MRSIRRYTLNSDIRSDETCLVFLHIPKAAGTSLCSLLVRNYPSRETIHLDILGFPESPNPRPFDEEMEKIPLEKRSKLRLLWGHMGYGVHKQIPRRCEYITVLREPIGRVISVYKYVVSNPSHVLHDYVVGQQVGLEEYVESGIDENQTENSQTRQLSGRQFGALDREALAEAKRNLEDFLVVGLTERFEETIVVLRRILKLRLPFYVTRNVSGPLDVSERAAQLILERNRLDLDLYRFAIERFSEHVSRYNRSFGLEVLLFRALRPLSRLAGEGGRTEKILRKLSQARAANTSR